MGIISVLAFGKKGRLYVKFLVAAAVLAVALYAYGVFASARGDAL